MPAAGIFCFCYFSTVVDCSDQCSDELASMLTVAKCLADSVVAQRNTIGV